MTRILFALVGLVVLTAVFPSSGEAQLEFCVRQQSGAGQSQTQFMASPTEDPSYFWLSGVRIQFNDLPANQLVIGGVRVLPSEAVLGWEGFPNEDLAVAAKEGGTVDLNTASGTGSGFHLTGGIQIPFTFSMQVQLGRCGPPY